MKRLTKFISKDEWRLFHPIYLGLGTGVAIPDIDMIIMIYFFAKGFTATQIGIGLALEAFFLLISEIPTGVFADRYGKRRSVQVSWYMTSVIFAAFFFITKPWMMWVLFSLRGVANTFSSGAFDALPYEIAKREKREDLINKYYSTLEFIFQISTALSNLNVILFLYLVGATTTYYFLGQAHQGLDFLWFTGFFGYFVGSTILSRLKDEVTQVAPGLKNNFKESVKVAVEALKYSKIHPVVSKLVLMGIFTKISTMLFSDLVYQPYLLNMGVKIENIAVLVALGSLLAALFSLISKTISKKVSTEKHYLEIMFSLKILMLLCLTFLTGPIFSLIFFLIYFGFDSLITPVLSPFKQYFYDKGMRATLGSVESVIRNLVSIVIFPLIGISLDNFGVTTTVLLAIFPLTASLLVFKSINHNTKLKH